NRNVLEFLAEDADRGALDAGERAEELLNGFVAELDKFLAWAVFLRHGFDRGRGADGNKFGEPLRLVVGTNARLPVLAGAVQVDAKPPDEQGDVAAQGAPVRMNFVQNQELAAVVS